MKDLDVPSQYKPLLDRYVIRITEALHYMEPILDELTGKKLEIDWNGWTVTIARKKEE